MACDDGRVGLWFLASDTWHFLEGHHGAVLGLATTPCGEQLIATSSDGTICVWDLAARRSIATLNGHEAGVTGAVLVPDTPFMITASEDGTVRIWDMVARRQRHAVKLDVPLECVALDVHGGNLLVGDTAGGVYCFAVER